MRLLALVFCAANAAFSGEFAVLANGARLHADRHEVNGDKVRLYTGAGFIELRAVQVQSFEAEEPRPVAVPSPQASAPAPATAAPATIHDLADAAADKYGLPRKLVRSVIAAESGFQADAVSPKGAIGPMQLMPATARELGVDPYDPAQNIDGGTRYLRDLLQRYGFSLWYAAAAYNAGPGAVDKYGGVPPYPETIRYVNKIDRAYSK